MNKHTMIPITEPSQKRVFSLIRAQGNASGANLAKQTGMQPSSLVYILNNLKDKGLIHVSGHGNSTSRGGKKPVLWQVNPGYGNILGMEVMRHAIRAVLVNLAGDVILKAEKDFRPGTPDKIVSRIQKIISEIISESGQSIDKLRYISLAVPGIVDPVSHNIIYSYGLNLKDFDLKVHIIDQFGIPTGVMNDANAGAIGDQWFTGLDLSINNALYLSYNPLAGGMGLGIIINRNLYTGSNGLAGEFSIRVPALHVIIRDKLKTIDEAGIMLTGIENPDSVQISDLFLYAKKGCVLSNEVLSALCKQVASEISRMIGLFDPDRITLGGDLSICEHMCCSEVMHHLKAMLQIDYPFIMNVPRMDYARSKVFAVAIGATALYLTSLTS
jgi:predicted NBD/HSP70 family sugar kinase